ncbi:MAG TPA: DUF2130 domain-containing protein [Patescibacteria group bacterium]|nr:DUF2130 domain-containing protein [Patescibacteria group bacterium]
MKNTIKCPQCGEEIEVNEAIQHQIEEKVIASTKLKLQDEADRKASERFDSKISRIEKEKEEEKERNKKLSSQIDELLTETRELRRKDEDRELEMKKKLLDEEEKIRLDARKKSEEEHDLKDKEKEKLIDDLKKSLEDAQRKATQGSQQTQGESLELTLESKLKSEFPSDIISEVKKGQRGADIVQEVVDKLGRKCGVILWESKNAQWTDSWIEKLKEDQRQAKADIAILISVNLPSDVNNFAYKNGVWVCSLSSFVALALAMRFNLVSVYHEKQSAVGVDEKMKTLYQYLTGNEFRHRIEGIVGAFASMQDDLEKEKRWFNVKWARQEKEIRKVMDHTHGMYGDLQGVIGKSLPEISSLELPENTDK